MKLTYLGPHDAVSLTLADGTYADVARGDTADVPEETVPARVAAGFSTGDAKKDLDLVGDVKDIPSTDVGKAQLKELIAERAAIILATRPQNVKKGDI